MEYRVALAETCLDGRGLAVGHEVGLVIGTVVLTFIMSIWYLNRDFK